MAKISVSKLTLCFSRGIVWKYRTVPLIQIRIFLVPRDFNFSNALKDCVLITKCGMWKLRKSIVRFNVYTFVASLMGRQTDIYLYVKYVCLCFDLLEFFVYFCSNNI